MKKFVYLYYGGGFPEDEAEGKKIMDAWGAWYGMMGDKISDAGSPFGDRKLVGEGEPSGVTGYSIIMAEDLAGAEEIAKEHPHLKMGGGTHVEVLEYVEMDH